MNTSLPSHSIDLPNPTSTSDSYSFKPLGSMFILAIPVNMVLGEAVNPIFSRME
jgi:hypothetical protein